MDIEEERNQIIALWDKILEDPKIYSSLVYIWEHKKEIRKLEARVQRLESHVLDILKILPDLRKHSFKEFMARSEELVGYLHHIEPTEEWVKRIQDDINLISSIIQQLREKGHEEMIIERQESVRTEKLVNIMIIKIQNLVNELIIFRNYLMSKGQGCKKTAQLLRLDKNIELGKIYLDSGFVDKIKSSNDPIKKLIDNTIIDSGNCFTRATTRIYALLIAYFDLNDWNLRRFVLACKDLYNTYNYIPGVQLIIPKILEPAPEGYEPELGAGKYIKINEVKEIYKKVWEYYEHHQRVGFVVDFHEQGAIFLVYTGYNRLVPNQPLICFHTMNWRFDPQWSFYE